MAILKDILINIIPVKTVGNMTTVVSSLCIDSRKVADGCAFIAIKGTLSDGHEFIGKAITSGASVIVCETMPEVLNDGVVYVQVKG